MSATSSATTNHSSTYRYITTLIQWSIGGVFDSGFVLAWAFIGPIIALIFFSFRHSMIWLLLYLANIVVTVLFDDFFSLHGYPVTEDTKVFFFVMNLSVSSLVVFVFATSYVTSAVSERENANRLLLNILPEKVAQFLKSRDGVIAEKYADASVLFADIVDFTRYSRTKQADQLVAKLNEIFFRFDELTDRSGLEKIKTVGDAYMIVGGVPEPKSGHAETIALFALDMLSTIKDIRKGRWRFVFPPHRYSYWTRRCGRHRKKANCLRSVGRYRKYREPDGVEWNRKFDPGQRSGLRDTEGEIPIQKRGDGERQRYWHNANVLFVDSGLTSNRMAAFGSHRVSMLGHDGRAMNWNEFGARRPAP